MPHPYDLITTEIMGLFVIICVALAQITGVVCRLPNRGVYTKLYGKEKQNERCICTRFGESRRHVC